MPKQKKYQWRKTSATTWTSNSERTYTGGITYSGSTTYTLLVSPGGYTTTATTLKNAKSAYRKYLLDK